MALRVIVDRLKCISAGSCVDVAPGVFQLDEEYVAVIINPRGAETGTIIAAAEACPVEAIRVIDEQAGQQLYP
jgi:ferredoxin